MGKPVVAKIVGESYRELLSKSDKEVAAEQLDLTVEQADLNFQQGLLSLKADMLKLEGSVKTEEGNLRKAEVALNNAKSSNPDTLVQCVITAYQQKKQAELNLAAAKESFGNMTELYKYLEQTKESLFN